MAARELRHARRSSQPLLKRGRCPGAQPRSRTNEGAIANRLVHRRPTAGMCATSQVEDHACDDGAAATGHVLIRIRRWKEGWPLADSHKPWLMQADFTASLLYRRLKQRAQGTAATASVSAVPTRRRNHWNRRSRPRNACGVKRRRRPGIAGAAGGNSGNIGLYPLGLGPLKCPFSKGFVSGFLIFKSPEIAGIRKFEEPESMGSPG